MFESLDKVLRVAQLTLSAAALAAMAACGGGGSKGTSSAGSTSSTAVVSGVASKGWVKNGIATAYAVVNGSKGRILASARTNDKGEYTLTGIPAGSLVLVEITGDTNTKMVDEASNVDVAVPATFSLRAVTKLESGTQVSSATLQITPFSEMAVAQANRRSGGLTEANAATANAEIRKALGFDVFSEQPAFSKDGQTPQNAAALVLAAVSRLANDGARGCTSGGVADKVSCVVGKMSLAGTDDTTLISELNDAITDTASNEAFKGELPPAATVVEEGSPALTSTQLGGIAQAKTLIASLRNSSELTDAGPSGIASRRTAITQALKEATEPFTDAQANLLLAAIQAINDMASSDAATFRSDMAVGSAQCYYVAQMPSTEAFPASLSEPSDWSKVAGAVCLSFVGTDSNNRNHYQWQEALITKPVSGTAYTVTSRIGTYDGAGSLLTTHGTFFGNKRFIAQATPQLRNGQTNNINLKGDVVPLTSALAYADYDRLNVDINVVPSVAANPLASRMTITGLFKVLNAANVATNTLGLKAGSYVEAKTTTPGTLGAGLVRLPTSRVDNSLSTAHLLVSMLLNTGEGLDGIIDASNVQTDATGENDVPSLVSFEGQYKDAISTLFDGKATVTLLNVPQVNTKASSTASNFIKATATLLGKIAGASGELANVNLSFSHNTDYTVQSITGSIQKAGSETVLLNVVRNPAVSDSTTLKLSTATGVSINLQKISDKTTPRDIMKDGVVVGQYHPDKATVYYADQTSERY